MTSREIMAGLLIDHALSKRAGKSPVLPGVDTPRFAEKVSDELMEYAVFLEAETLPVVQLSEKELSQSFNKVQILLSSWAAWNALKLTREDALRVLKRKLLAKKYVSFRSRSHLIPITDMEVQRYFQENRHKFGAQAELSQFQGEIRAHLEQSLVERRLQEWYALLRSKYQIRNDLLEL